MGTEDELVTPHATYNQQGRTLKARRDAYRAGFDEPMDEFFVQHLRDATNKAWVFGDERFCSEIEGKLNRRALPRPRGGDRRSEAYRRSLERDGGGESMSQAGRS
jgi:putative transposase